MTTVDRILPGGARESAGLVDAAAYHAIPRTLTVDWSDARLARVTRLRLLSDPGFPVWDVSYCHGELTDGTPVHVSLPFSQLPKGAVSRAIVSEAKRDGVFAKRLGILSAISTLI